MCSTHFRGGEKNCVSSLPHFQGLQEKFALWPIKANEGKTHFCSGRKLPEMFQRKWEENVRKLWKENELIKHADLNASYVANTCQTWKEHRVKAERQKVRRNSRMETVRTMKSAPLNQSSWCRQGWSTKDSDRVILSGTWFVYTLERTQHQA